MNTRNVTYNTRPVQLRLKPELHDWVHAEAQKQERSANWIINRVLEMALAGGSGFKQESNRNAGQPI